MLEIRNEQSYFYKMTKNAGKNLLSKKSYFVLPKERVNELVNNFVKQLEDLSVSRTSFDWGIPIIENPNHVIYVWLDALLNYLTATGYMSVNNEQFDYFWNDKNTEIVHFTIEKLHVFTVFTDQFF